MLTSILSGVIGGVATGVVMYIIRQKRRTDSLRQAIATEIRNTPVGAAKASILGVNALKTPIIDANLGKINLLSNREVELVTQYHQHMAKVRDVNERKSANDRVRIPVSIVERGDELSSETVDTLEASMWTLTTPSWLKSPFSRTGEKTQKRESDADNFDKRAWELQQEAANKDLDEERVED
ncbi:hypothetical protein [Haloarcula amylolytica]|uniref:hypothetical protein n=1 Tax=Haloarcula amylolytica TaxID=396317 RepID=UPI0006781D65|nr:hypothetical protein [Haloarcula amylolytica]